MSRCHRFVPFYRPSEPCSLFVFDHGGLTPISDDADRIYEANKEYVEQFTVKQVLPPLPSQKDGKIYALLSYSYDWSETNSLSNPKCSDLPCVKVCCHRDSNCGSPICKTGMLTATPRQLTLHNSLQYCSQQCSHSQTYGCCPVIQISRCDCWGIID